MGGSLTQVATSLISQLGYSGLTVGLMLDSAGLPIPSEILIPLATVLALQGRFELWAVFAAGVAGQVLGALAGYWLGRYGGEPLLERYGKYVLVTRRDLARAHKAFARYGIWLAMLGRCVPGVRGVIAYPAGVAEMRLGTFIGFTALGSAVWTAALMYLGYAIGNNAALMDQIAAKSSLVGLLFILAFVAWHFRHLRPRSGGRKS